MIYVEEGLRTESIPRHAVYVWACLCRDDDCGEEGASRRVALAPARCMPLYLAISICFSVFRVYTCVPCFMFRGIDMDDVRVGSLDRS